MRLRHQDDPDSLGQDSAQPLAGGPSAPPPPSMADTAAALRHFAASLGALSETLEDRDPSEHEHVRRYVTLLLYGRDDAKKRARDWVLTVVDLVVEERRLGRGLRRVFDKHFTDPCARLRPVATGDDLLRYVWSIAPQRAEVGRACSSVELFARLSRLPRESPPPAIEEAGWSDMTDEDAVTLATGLIALFHSSFADAILRDSSSLRDMIAARPKRYNWRAAQRVFEQLGIQGPNVKNLRTDWAKHRASSPVTLYEIRRKP